MLKTGYAKNTYVPKCQNTHGPKLWLLDTWAWAHGPGRMGGRPAAGPPPGKCVVGGEGAMPMCSGAKALAHEYFDIWDHKYF